MQKPNPMKSRGVRFDDDQWRKIEARAADDRTGRTKPSDVVRYAVDELFKKKKS